MNLIEKLVFGVSLLSLSAMVDATDTWKFHFDIDTRGIKDERTDNNVIFRLMKNNEQIGYAHRNGICEKFYDKTFSCAWVNNVITFKTDDTPTAVEVHIEGDDALMIDHAWIKKDGRKEQTWGVNNQMGYCLSEDPDDIDGSWRDHTHECVPARSFLISGGTETEKAISHHHSYASVDTVCMDLKTRGVNINKAGTNDNVTVFTYRGDVMLDVKTWPAANFQDPMANAISKVLDPNFDGESFLCLDLHRDTNSKANAVEVCVRGNDALLIDQIRLSRFGNWRHYESWGANNNLGWCLSQDPNDANGSFRNHAPDGCNECVKFNEDGSYEF